MFRWLKQWNCLFTYNAVAYSTRISLFQKNERKFSFRQMLWLTRAKTSKKQRIKIIDVAVVNLLLSTHSTTAKAMLPVLLIKEQTLTGVSLKDPAKPFMVWSVDGLKIYDMFLWLVQCFLFNYNDAVYSTSMAVSEIIKAKECQANALPSNCFSPTKLSKNQQIIIINVAKCMTSPTKKGQM